VRVRRKLEGRHEVVLAPLPAMITVVREINTPRYPTVPMRLAAAEAPVPIWDNKIMQLDENRVGLKGSPTQVRRIFSPERVKGEIISRDGDRPDDVARRLIEKMLERDTISL
ncbi:MAG: hypothetical protein N2506_04685, partial [Dehalococcoidales bacterium]|nr:hypothetical protein [Dehalococcoidales bacterium]